MLHRRIAKPLLIIPAVFIFLLGGCGGSSRFCIGCDDSFLIADADAARQVASGTEVILDASDSEGDIDDYNWIQLTGPLVVINNPGSRRASFIAPDVEESTTLVFRLTITNDFGGSDSDRVGVIVVPRPQLAATVGSRTVLDQLKPQKLLNAPLPSASLTLPGSTENRMTYVGLWLSVLAAQPVWHTTSVELDDVTLRLDEVRALVRFVESQSDIALSELPAQKLHQGFSAIAEAVAGKSPLLASQLQDLLASDIIGASVLADVAVPQPAAAASAYRLLGQTPDGMQLRTGEVTALEAEMAAVQLLLSLNDQQIVDTIEVAVATLVLLHSGSVVSPAPD